MQTLIDAETEKQLKEKFKNEMKDEVDIKLFKTDIILDTSNTFQKDANEFSEQLLKELNKIEPRIKYEVKGMNDEIAKKLNIKTSPTILIGYDKGYRIVYNGAPLGYEASGFIDTITYVSRGYSGLSSESEAILKNIDKETKIQVFVTPSCPYCPKAVVLANGVAIAAKSKVIAECVEAQENHELSMMYNVSSVPQQVIDGKMDSITIGVQPEKNFVMQVLKYGAPDKYNDIISELEAARKEKEKLADSPDYPVYLTDNNFKEAINKYKILVVDCWAEWCMPCKMIAPVVEELAKELKGQVTFGKLNVDEEQKIAVEYNIMSIPTLLVFENGKLKGNIVGAMAKEQLLEQIKKYVRF